MNGTGAEIAALGLGIGLMFSLVCYLLTNLSPGGMITPGWLALAMVATPERVVIIAVVTAATAVLTVLLRRYVILYGKRLFASVVMVGIFVQMTVVVALVNIVPSLTSGDTIGFIIPGLMAYQLVRQPTGATLLAISSVSSMAYGVIITGVLLGFVDEGPGGFTSSISAEPLGLSPAGLLAVVAVIGLTTAGLVLSLGRIRKQAAPPPPLAPPRAHRAAPVSTVVTVPRTPEAELAVGVNPLTVRTKLESYVGSFLPAGEAERVAEALSELPGTEAEKFVIAIEHVQNRRGLGSLVNAIALVRHGGFSHAEAAVLAGANESQLTAHFAATEDRPLF